MCANSAETAQPCSVTAAQRCALADAEMWNSNGKQKRWLLAGVWVPCVSLKATELYFMCHILCVIWMGEKAWIKSKTCSEHLWTDEEGKLRQALPIPQFHHFSQWSWATSPRWMLGAKASCCFPSEIITEQSDIFRKLKVKLICMCKCCVLLTGDFCLRA